ncbi:MAG: nucleotide-binding protein [Firmicutes bacterium ML8_F2]|nr:MAG: nucleotide-binding protein [Firmicutes bacterium ML8_F2]
MPKVIDANILLKFLSDDDPDKTAACETLLLMVEKGKEKVFLPDLVIAEIVWTLEKFYKVEKKRIKELLTTVFAAEGLICPDKGRLLSALAIYAAKNIDWTDAFVAVQMIENRQPEIYSYNSGFDQLPEIIRLEP